MSEIITLSIKTPRDSSTTPEAAKTMLSALTKINGVGFWEKILLGKKPKGLALEIASIGQEISFLISADKELIPFIESQIQSNYPTSTIQKISDPLKNENLNIISLTLVRGNYYPLAVYKDFSEIDPLSSLLAVLTKMERGGVFVFQIALESVDEIWQSRARDFAERGTRRDDGTYTRRPDANIIFEKINYPGFRVSLRLISNSNTTQTEFLSALGVFNRPDGNSIKVFKIPLFDKNREKSFTLNRRVLGGNILNIEEIATLWHLPNEKIKVPGVAWGGDILSEPPNNLPIAEGLDESQKLQINFFAKTIFKNHNAIFGIKDADRLRHIWTVGKTGTGKSTMIANMAIDDFKKGRGVAVIDPHGDLCEDLLDYIPKNRINDTIYFNPADREFPITINPLEVTNREEAELVTSGLMSIFTKVWANVWSARMEYILRNSFLTLTEIPGTTLSDVLSLLANRSYRNRVYSKINDPALIHFWKEEFEKMPDRLQKEAIAPIQNKVGQFVTSPIIRRVIGYPKSTVSLDEVINNKKIFIANLSQGRLGEDNAALLGATLITKFQLAAMRRVDISKEQRTPFFLYVDEFQNFATDSFIKILSEARKFGLSLTLANQYMGQLPEHVTKAILGNAGTLIAFAVGAEDASRIHKEFAEVFSQNDLVNLQNFQIAIRMTIDGHIVRPFVATTLPLPMSRNQNREKVIRVSRERYAKKLKNEKVRELENTEIEENQTGTPNEVTILEHK